MKVKRRDVPENHALDNVVADPFLRDILLSRGINDPKDLDPSIKNMLHYRDLKDITIASKTIADAIEAHEHIRIMGDYDVDGMTGTALGVLCLRAFKHDNVSFHVPSRYDNGYGLSVKMVEKAIADGVDLIVTVDNGISCHEAVSFAKEHGLKVVITDHHEPTAILPDAIAIVDPKRVDCAFKSKNLCGVGVLFYVLIATRAELIARGYFKDLNSAPAMGQFLDLVAIGTVGDVVTFDANNRRLVKAGLMRMHQGSAQLGVRALSEVSRVNLENITTSNIAFDLCPRLNAAGRIMISDNPSVKCLLSSDGNDAMELARRLDMINRRRGDYERVYLAEAREEAKVNHGKSSVVVFKPNWLCGVAGLIASRLKDSFGTPCFVFAGDGEEITGSARSVPGFPLASNLSQIDKEYPGLLLRFGGHAMAAGATIKKTDIQKFREIFDEKAQQILAEGGEEIGIESDGELPPSHFCLDFARALEYFGPWGQGYPEPVFDGIYEIEDIKPLGTGRSLRFKLANSKIAFYALRFRANAREKTLLPGMQVHVAYALAVDRYYQNERLAIIIKAIEPI